MTTNLKKIENQILADAKDEAELVRYLHARKQVFDRAKEEYDEAKQAVIAHARLHRGDRKSLELEADEGKLRVRVSFGTTTAYDGVALEKIAAALGDGVFEQLFKKTVSYSPTRSLAAWLKRQGDSKLKHLVLSTADIKNRAPDVRWSNEASEEDEP